MELEELGLRDGSMDSLESFETLLKLGGKEVVGFNLG